MLSKIESLKIAIKLLESENWFCVVNKLKEVLEDYEDGDEGIVKCGCCGKELKRCDATLVNDDRIYICNNCPEEIK